MAYRFPDYKFFCYNLYVPVPPAGPTCRQPVGMPTGSAYKFLCSNLYLPVHPVGPNCRQPVGMPKGSAYMFLYVNSYVSVQPVDQGRRQTVAERPTKTAHFAPSSYTRAGL